MPGFDRRKFLNTAAMSAALVAPAAAREPKAAAPRQAKPDEAGPRQRPASTGGFSEGRLGRMHAVLAGHVERGALPGLVTLVARHGEVRVDAIGMKAVGGKNPLRHDTIFRIASMTKPVTAVAADPGRFGWDGGYGTSGYSDPKENLVGILMT